MVVEDVYVKRIWKPLYGVRQWNLDQRQDFIAVAAKRQKHQGLSFRTLYVYLLQPMYMQYHSHATGDCICK